MTVHDQLRALVGRLAEAGVASPESEAWELIEAATGSRRPDLLMEPRALRPEERKRLAEWLARREAREPLQLILGRAHFYGFELLVAQGVLIPRPETERLVELALEALVGVDSPRIVDVGSGSGAVALALKRERPDATVLATDVDPAALAATARNARELGLELELVESDLLSHPRAAAFAARADALVSNPPYLPLSDRKRVPPELSWEPDGALFAGDDGLALFRRLVPQALTLLPPGALLLLELDPRNVFRAAAEARVGAQRADRSGPAADQPGDEAVESAWRSRVVHRDLAGRPRFLELRS